MFIRYNFAFKNSKLRKWQRPSPPNFLITDASFKKKLLYILQVFRSNSVLFYPSSFILLITLFINLFAIYPTSKLRNLEEIHQKYTSVINKLSALDTSKRRFTKNIKNIDEFFSQPTTTYLFTYYLQNSVPKGVQLNSFSFSDNGFDINATSYSLESLNQFITLIIESPVIVGDSVTINRLDRKENFLPESQIKVSIYDLEIYGQVNKLDIIKREDLYKDSEAYGLLKKLQRFNHLKKLLKS